MDRTERIEALVSLFAKAISGCEPSELERIESALSARPIAIDNLSLALNRQARDHNPPSVDLAGASLPRLIPIEKGQGFLREMVAAPSAAWIGSEVVAIEDAASAVGVSVATFDGWSASDQFIVLRSTREGAFVPLDQFKEGRPVSGIADVVALFPNSEEAWAWLAAPNALLQDERPIDSLHAGQASYVVRAAAGSLDFV